MNNPYGRATYEFAREFVPGVYRFESWPNNQSDLYIIPNDKCLPYYDRRMTARCPRRQMNRAEESILYRFELFVIRTCAVEHQSGAGWAQRVEHGTQTFIERFTPKIHIRAAILLIQRNTNSGQKNLGLLFSPASLTFGDRHR